MDVAEYYCDVLGRPTCTRSVMVEMAQAIRDGMAPEVIKAALRDASDAPRPTWRYAWAIICRCLGEGCLTMEGWAARKAAHQAARQAAKVRDNPALNYAQRSFDEHYFDGIYADLSSPPEAQ